MVARTHCLLAALSITALFAMPVSAAAPAAAAEPAPVPEAVAQVNQAFETLAMARPGAPRLAAAETVIELGKQQSAVFANMLDNVVFTSSLAERRKLLEDLGFMVPDEGGRFRYPTQRPDGKKKKEPEWLAVLVKQSARPSVTESIRTVVTLRALAASKDPAAAESILNFAFGENGVVYRDECGRHLRAMDPYSLPSLLRYSAKRKRRDNHAKARYAAYQLDRLNKGRPSYSLMAAPNEEIEVAVLNVLGEVKHPDGVAAVLERTNSPRRAIRSAARAAWRGYVEGPPPRPAPMSKRRLPGSKFTEEEFPLYLNYRDLALEEVRRAYQQALQEKPRSRFNAKQLTDQLFAFYDQQRFARFDQMLAEANQLRDQGDFTNMGKKYDELLVRAPMHPRRVEMIAGYIAHGKQLANDKQWQEAARSFNKALSLEPGGKHAEEANAELMIVRTALMEAKDADVARELAAALLDPNSLSMREARRQKAKRDRGWMLYTGLAAGFLALLLLGAIWRLRRRARIGARSWPAAN